MKALEEKNYHAEVSQHVQKVADQAATHETAPAEPKTTPDEFVEHVPHVAAHLHVHHIVDSIVTIQPAGAKKLAQQCNLVHVKGEGHQLEDLQVEVAHHGYEHSSQHFLAKLLEQSNCV
jgi:hypothetical protein